MFNYTQLIKLLPYVFLPVIMLNYYLAMHGINTYSYILLPCLLALIVFSIPMLWNNIKKGRNELFSIFLLYNLFSVVFYLFNGRPMVCYTSALRYVVFPMLFYLYAQNEKDDSSFFYYSLLYSCLFCFVVGLYLYIVGPDYYKSFLMNARENAWYTSGFSYQEEDVLSYSRMSSFFGSSYNVCFFSVPALIVSSMFSLNKNDTFKKWHYYVIALVSLMSAILCMQRLSMATSVIFLIFFVFYSIIKKQRVSTIVFILIIIIVVNLGFLLINSDRGSTIYELLMGRVDNLSYTKAMLERSGISVNVLKNWNYYIFGGGVGSYGYVAMKYGFDGVSDAEYIRILTENGIVGASVFIAIIISHLIDGIRNIKVYGIEVCIIVFYLMAFSGSNAISMSFTFSPVFWYALGHIQNKAYKQRYLYEQSLV